MSVPAQATTWYVGKSGNDANSCNTAQSPDAADRKLTIAAGITCLNLAGGGGHSVIIGDGVYVERISPTQINSGTSNNANRIIGENGVRTTAAAILRPSGAVRVVEISSTRSWISIENLDLDGTNTTLQTVKINGPSATNISLINNEIHHPHGGAATPNDDAVIQVDDGVSLCILRGNVIHSSGSHGIYMRGNKCLVEYNEIYNTGNDADGGYGIQLFSQNAGHNVTSNIVQYNLFPGPGNKAIYCCTDSGNIVHHNIIHDYAIVPSSADGMRLTGTNKIFNNTITGASALGLSGSGSATISASVEVKNNISFGNGTDTITGGTAENNTTTDPSFVNTAADNYNVASGQASNGTDLTASGVSHNCTAGRGALDPMEIVSASTLDANTIRVVVCNAFGALRNATTTTGWTVKVGGSSKTIAATSAASSTAIDIDINFTMDASSTVTVSYSQSTGSLLNSIGIGSKTDATGNAYLLSATDFAVTNTLTGGTTFYGSPSGSGSTCSSGSPCSLSTLLGKAAPDVTLILKDGTYSGSGTVVSLGTTDGTSGHPITLKAENPGMALILGDGTAGEVLKFVSANWWIVEGLRVENVDNAAYTGSSASVVYIDSNSADNIFRKNIVRNPNRWGNNIGIHVGGDRNLIEENDLLIFHRNGIQAFGTGATENVFRLNYVGQTATNLAGSGQPNDGYVAYDSPNNRWESNIFESSLGADGGGIGFAAWAADNKYYGNICIKAEQNCMTLVSAASVTTGADNYIVRDQANIGMQDYGLFLRSPINADVQNVTAHTSQTPDRGFVADNGDAVGTTSLVLRNGMFINTTGVFTSPITSVTISHSQEFGSSSSWGTGTSGRTDSPPASPGDVDPAFGDCRVNVPSTSPFSGVGQLGADIGANAIWVYSGGSRTTERMFDNTLSGADRGKALRGPAVISGVNDSSTGNVRSTVHQRIGFGTGSCQFPSNYNPGGGPEDPPATADVGHSSETAATTSHDAVVPLNIAVGDLLILHTSMRPSTTLSGLDDWTQPTNGRCTVATGLTLSGDVYYKIAEGDEADFTITSADSAKSITRIYRISSASWHGTTPPEVNCTTGTSTNPDPPALTPSWGSDNLLWLALFTRARGDNVVTAYPTNYDSNQFNDDTGTFSSDVQMAAAGRGLDTATEDPDAFTVNGNQNWAAFTVGVRPVVAGGGGGEPVATWEQRDYCWKYWQDAETVACSFAQNTAAYSHPNGKIVARIGLSVTAADPESSAHVAEYRINSGTWTALGNTCTSPCIHYVAPSVRSDGQATTRLLTLPDGLTFAAGNLKAAAGTTGTFDFAENAWTEFDHSLQLQGLTAGDVVEVRMRKEVGDLYDTYTRYPTLNVVAAVASAP